MHVRQRSEDLRFDEEIRNAARLAGVEPRHVEKLRRQLIEEPRGDQSSNDEKPAKKMRGKPRHHPGSNHRRNIRAAKERLQQRTCAAAAAPAPAQEGSM